MVSLASTSRVMVFPVRVLTKICILVFRVVLIQKQTVRCRPLHALLSGALLTHPGMYVTMHEASRGGRNAQKLLSLVPRLHRHGVAFKNLEIARDSLATNL